MAAPFAAPRSTLAVLALGLGVTALACQEPTEAIVEISTNAECSAIAGTGITAGKVGEVELASYDTVTTQCQGEGDIGSIVLLPDGDKSGAFAFKVVASLGTTDVEDCKAPLYGPSCIVAQRSMHFVPNLPFHVPLKLGVACAGVLCPDGQTCVDGTCVSADCDPAAGCVPEPDIPPPWAKQIGGPGAQMARDVARGADGVIAVAGNFTDAVDLGGGEVTGGDSQDIFLATYSPAGALRWSLTFGGSGDDEGIAVAVGRHGDVFALGVFEDTVDFGGGNVTSHGGWDIALLKISPAGKLAWALGLGGKEVDTVGKIAVDDSGNVYISGSFSGTATFAGTELVSAGMSDGFVASFSSAGKLRWAKSIGGPDDDFAGPIAVGGGGEVYVGGTFWGPIPLGAEPLVPIGGADAFVASFGGDGALRWAKSFGSSGQDVVSDLAARADRVVCTGMLSSAATIDGVPLPAVDGDGFVVSLDSDGKHVWSEVFGGQGLDVGTALDVGEDDAVFLGGSIYRGPVFGGPEIKGAGARSPFAAVLERDGALRWMRQLESSLAGDVTGIAASPDGYGYFAGWFTDKLAYDGTTFTSKDAEDMFLLRMAPPDAGD